MHADSDCWPNCRPPAPRSFTFYQAYQCIMREGAVVLSHWSAAAPNLSLILKRLVARGQ